jgi:hypothetical protein
MNSKTNPNPECNHSSKICDLLPEEKGKKKRAPSEEQTPL